MLRLLNSAFASPTAFFGFMIAASAAALAAALIAQFAFHLSPCVLCLYQRMPFIAVTVLGLIGIALEYMKRPPTLPSPQRGEERNAQHFRWGMTEVLAALIALAFLIDAALAVYHSGVERHWWESAFEACHLPDMPAGETDSQWIDRILSQPAVPCGQIQWADPVFGLTMANYNVLYCLMLFALSVIFIRRHSPNSQSADTLFG